jgi:hypothetical protein
MMHAKGPLPPAPLTTTPPSTKDKQSTTSGNGRIRCPHCAWQPRKSDHWQCHCGCRWHTFDTGGKCPDCGWHWSQTQCPRCAKWAAHLAWYEDPNSGNPLN